MIDKYLSDMDHNMSLMLRSENNQVHIENIKLKWWYWRNSLQDKENTLAGLKDFDRFLQHKNHMKSVQIEIENVLARKEYKLKEL